MMLFAVSTCYVCCCFGVVVKDDAKPVSNQHHTYISLHNKY